MDRFNVGTNTVLFFTHCSYELSTVPRTASLHFSTPRISQKRGSIMHMMADSSSLSCTWLVETCGFANPSFRNGLCSHISIFSWSTAWVAMKLIFMYVLCTLCLRWPLDITYRELDMLFVCPCGTGFIVSYSYSMDMNGTEDVTVTTRLSLDFKRDISLSWQIRTFKLESKDWEQLFGGDIEGITKKQG